MTIGSRVYSLGVVMLGIVEFKFGSFSSDWLTVPPHLPGYQVLAYGSFTVLVVMGLAMNLRRTAAIGALSLTVYFGLATLAAQLPLALKTLPAWGGWQGVAESAIMALGGALSFGQGSTTLVLSAPHRQAIGRSVRWGFGLGLLVFGVSHFVYAKFTASLAPAWLPPSQLFWAYATGLLQIAAGLALLSNVRARLAAILLTLMYLGFAALVHIPSIIAVPSSHGNWAENAINLILTGAAWRMAEGLPKATPPPGEPKDENPTGAQRRAGERLDTPHK